MTARNMKMAIAGMALALFIAACGTAGAETPDPTREAPGGAPTTTSDPGGHESMDSNMGDANATRAYDVTGAAVVSGSFSALSKATTNTIGGSAWLARHTNGTTVSIELEGLEPGAMYVGHVHADVCSAGGGAHYRHDEAGADRPPNEIHLAFTAGPGGTGMMTAENPTVASDLAVSVVVHEAGDGTPKLACADLVN